jgi:hypothetical protein
MQAWARAWILLEDRDPERDLSAKGSSKHVRGCRSGHSVFFYPSRQQSATFGRAV